MLANTSGLTWIDDKRILFSEIKLGCHKHGESPLARIEAIPEMCIYHRRRTEWPITPIFHRITNGY